MENNEVLDVTTDNALVHADNAPEGGSSLKTGLLVGGIIAISTGLGWLAYKVVKGRKEKALEAEAAAEEAAKA